MAKLGEMRVIKVFSVGKAKYCYALQKYRVLKYYELPGWDGTDPVDDEPVNPAMLPDEDKKEVLGWRSLTNTGSYYNRRWAKRVAKHYGLKVPKDVYEDEDEDE